MSSEKSSNPNYKLQKKLMRRRALRESWPLLVWLGVAALAVWAYRTGGDFERMRGVVSKPIEVVRAPLEGTLVVLPVNDPDVEGIPRDENGQPKKLEQGVYVNATDLVEFPTVALLATVATTGFCSLFFLFFFSFFF